MRLQKYLNISCSDKSINKFRMLNVDLCKDKYNNKYEDIVKEIEKRFQIKSNILQDINKYNKELKRIYSKDICFQLSLIDEDNNTKSVDIDKKEKIKKIHLKLNDKLSQIKLDIENILAKNK
jgi:hypothetical protein